MKTTILKNNEEFIDDAFMVCSLCGKCRQSCPSYLANLWEFTSPRGRIETTFGLKEGHIELTERVNRTMHQCFSCGACVEICPAHVDVRKAILLVRQAAFEEGIPLSKDQTALLEQIKNTGNYYGKSSIVKDEGDGDVLVYLGCKYSTDEELFQQLINQLTELGIKYKIVGKDKCCGFPFYLAGDIKEFEKHQEALAEEIKNTSGKILITPCPEGIEAFKQSGKIDIEVKHITEFLAEYSDKIKGKSKYKKIYYHDPCYLARIAGVTEEPRQLLENINGIELVSWKFSGKKTLCSGSGAGFTELADPEESEAVLEMHIKAIKEMGAEAIVTACPHAYEQFKKQNEIPVFTVEGFIQECK